LCSNNASYPFKYKPVPKSISTSLDEIIALFKSQWIETENMVKELIPK